MGDTQRQEPAGDVGGGAGAEAFDGARFIVRARRLADLSQRELADALGVSRAAIGRLESGAARVETGTLSAILALAGLRLAVLDGAGAEVAPVPVDVLRDRADRRFPGHLDARPPVDAPSDRVHPRRGVPEPRGWYHQRPSRARRRAITGTPADHPTVSGLREARRAAYWQGVAQAEARRALDPEPECCCFDGCFELACRDDCPCQCEPDRRGALHREPYVGDWTDHAARNGGQPVGRTQPAREVTGGLRRARTVVLERSNPRTPCVGQRSLSTSGAPRVPSSSSPVASLLWWRE
ncbi:helix-turn-helix transcriptional regulator [Terrabacter sp. NPDC000476]|uniref:helix-turn-helix domain-containing protein n=1 Tax=Terrabacter sp. NPDC000476 TaxID=3154258 RepID=UPI003324D748